MNRVDTLRCIFLEKLENCILLVDFGIQLYQFYRTQIPVVPVFDIFSAFKTFFNLFHEILAAFAMVFFASSRCLPCYGMLKRVPSLVF